MAWRLARSLEKLRAEVNAAAPSRSKRSDGTIGDAAHRASASDHNPNSRGVVCALDLTHDPGAGADMNAFAEQLRKSGHPALKYIIWNRRIWSKAKASQGWRYYGGSNPHSSHMHVSVGVGYDGRSTGPYDDTSAWGISSTSTTGDISDMLGLHIGSEGEGVKLVQLRVIRAGFGDALGEDGADSVYGPATAEGVRQCREYVGSKAEAGYGDKMTAHAVDQLEAAVTKRMLAEASGAGGADSQSLVGATVTSKITRVQS